MSARRKISDVPSLDSLHVGPQEIIPSYPGTQPSQVLSAPKSKKIKGSSSRTLSKTGRKKKKQLRSTLRNTLWIGAFLLAVWAGFALIEAVVESVVDGWFRRDSIIALCLILLFASAAVWALGSAKVEDFLSRRNAKKSNPKEGS
ncbi:MAG: hypothetical protein FWG15_02155 [Propionibacteriaceae bacterium]|nr:hypothetical protein [Propionibacteriaceae bacterium]